MSALEVAQDFRWATAQSTHVLPVCPGHSWRADAAEITKQVAHSFIFKSLLKQGLCLFLAGKILFLNCGKQVQTEIKPWLAESHVQHNFHMESKLAGFSEISNEANRISKGMHSCFSLPPAASLQPCLALHSKAWSIRREVVTETCASPAQEASRTWIPLPSLDYCFIPVPCKCFSLCAPSPRAVAFLCHNPDWIWRIGVFQLFLSNILKLQVLDRASFPSFSLVLSFLSHISFSRFWLISLFVSSHLASPMLSACQFLAIPTVSPLCYLDACQFSGFQLQYF